jgi:hypothetical protein
VSAGGRDETVQITLTREQLGQLTDLLGGGHQHDEQIREAAAEQACQGPDNGYAIGYDVGLGTRPEFAAGLFAGLDAGNAERRRVARDLMDRMTPARRPGRQHDREAGQ